MQLKYYKRYCKDIENVENFEKYLNFNDTYGLDVENTIFIIVSDVYMDVSNYLIKNGLFENKDFINGNFLLKPDKMNANDILNLI